MALLESELEVSGQAERERDERKACDNDAGTSDSAQAAHFERVQNCNVAVHCQQHRQPDTQQSQEVNSWIHPRVNTTLYTDVPHRAHVAKRPAAAAHTAHRCFLADVNLRSRSLYAIGRPSVCCLSVVCDVGAPYSGG